MLPASRSYFPALLGNHILKKQLDLVREKKCVYNAAKLWCHLYGTRAQLELDKKLEGFGITNYSM